MTVSTTESRIGYNGNGATTVFAFPYRFLESSDLTVIVVLATGTQVTQVLNTNYTVSGAGDDAGGTVTMIVAPASGEQLVIVREVPLTQETDYISGDPFPAETHERALDKLTMISQRLESLISRSIRLSDADLLVTSTILPPPSPGSSLIWNLTGTALVNGVPVEGTLAISPFMEIVLGSADADEARANILAAADAAVVKLTGAQTVAGVKTFSDKPVIPDGTAAQNPVSKAQLDAAAAAAAAAVVPATIAPTLLVAGTAIPTTSGTTIDLSLVVPSWARRLTVMLDKMSLSSTSSLLVQIGDSGGFETADYVSASTGTTGAGGGLLSSVAGFIVRFNAAALVVSGHMTLTHAGGNAWVASHSAGDSSVCMVGGGSKTLSGTLDRIRITTVSGTDTFDAGQVVLMWE